ncbi:hypothetical protein DRJ88_16015, partial [Enterococcus faecalis]
LVILSSFLVVGLVDLMSSRKNIVETSSQVPEGMADWVDSMVLLCVSLVDSEFCQQLRKFHRIYGNGSDEKNYEIVSPNFEEKVYFSTRIAGERPFFYAYDFFFSQMSITLPFTPFETNLLWSCNVAP